MLPTLLKTNRSSRYVWLSAAPQYPFGREIVGRPTLTGKLSRRNGEIFDANPSKSANLNRRSEYILPEVMTVHHAVCGWIKSNKGMKSPTKKGHAVDLVI